MKIRAGIVTGLIALALPLAAHAQSAPATCGVGELPPCPPPPSVILIDDIATSTMENVAKTIYLSATTTDGGPITFSIVDTAEAHGTVGTPSGNEALYTPDLGFTGPASFTYRATASETDFKDATVTITVEPAPEPETVQIAIRRNATLIGPIEVELPAEDAADGALAPTGTTTTYNIPARSVLALLSTLDSENTDFAVTDLAYFSSFSSFIVNCIDVEPSDSPDCFSWTYAVNGSFPAVGMDVTELGDGDVVYIFFGSQYQISTDKTEVITGEEFAATVEKYNASTNEYEPAPEMTLGVVVDPFAFPVIEIATTTADVDGNGAFTLTATGTYAIGISESGYFPHVFVTVSELEEETPPPSGGGGGGITHLSFNVPLAVSYLSSKQNADGSFENDLLTAWTALAFSAYDAGTAKTSLRNFLLTYSPALASATDYERHAMALMSLGIDPYSGAGRDYISPIVGFFDGVQVGDAALATDDIFALFPLTHAGYSASDTMIQKIVAFVVNAQQSNGSWIGGVDVTAAAVQGLAPFTSQTGVSDALTKAQNYLRTQQQTNGGFSDSFATSWTMQAIAALGQTGSQWPSSAGFYPTDYLASLQQTDGGVEPSSASASNRVWATAYAVPAALGKTWNSLLSSFSKPAHTPTGGTASTATTTPPATATSTAPVATSTESMATSTTAAPETSPTPEGEVLGLSIERAVALAADESVPDEVIEDIEEAVGSLAAIADDGALSDTQVAAAAAGIPEMYYFLFALFVLLLYGFAWYTLSWKRSWK